MKTQERTPENKKRLSKMWALFIIFNLGIIAVAIALGFTADGDSLLASLSVGIMGLFIANSLIVPRLRRAIRDEPEPEPDASAPVIYGDIQTDHFN